MREKFAERWQWSCLHIQLLRILSLGATLFGTLNLGSTLLGVTYLESMLYGATQSCQVDVDQRYKRWRVQKCPEQGSWRWTKEIEDTKSNVRSGTVLPVPTQLANVFVAVRCNTQLSNRSISGLSSWTRRGDDKFDHADTQVSIVHYRNSYVGRIPVAVGTTNLNRKKQSCYKYSRS